LLVARFVVRGIDEHPVLGLEAESQAALGMIQPRRLDANAGFHIEASVFDIAELAPRAHLVKIHRKVGRLHLLRHDLFQAGLAAGRVKVKLAVGALVERAEEGDALDVIPVEVGDKNVSGKGSVTELALQFSSEHAEAGAAVKDINPVFNAHFDAGGVASVAEIFGLWSRRGPAHAPKPYLHAAPVLPVQ